MKILQEQLYARVAPSSFITSEEWINKKIKESLENDSLQVYLEIAYYIAKMDYETWNKVRNFLQIRSSNDQHVERIYIFTNEVVIFETSKFKQLQTFSTKEAADILAHAFTSMSMYEMAAYIGVLLAYSEESINAKEILTSLIQQLEQDSKIGIEEAHIFLDTDDDKLSEKIYQKLKEFIIQFDMVIESEGLPQKGSWWRKFKIKVKDSIQSEGVQRRLEDAEEALKKAHLDKVQSEIDLNQAQAAANLLQSVKDVPNAIFQIGSLVFVKYTDPKNGLPINLVRTLTREEVKKINKNPEVLNQPFEMLKLLKQFELEGVKVQLNEGNE